MNIADKGKAIQNYTASKEGIEVDRWGHVKFDRIVEGKGIKKYRYKLQKTTIRFEAGYSDGKWLLIQTYNINKLYDVLESKGWK